MPGTSLLHWYRGLSDREQRMLRFGTLAVAGALGWLLVIEPLQGALESAQSRRDAVAAGVERMQAIASRVEQLGGMPVRDNRDPAALAEEILRDGALSAREVKVDRRTADTLGASIDFKSTVAMLTAVRGLESAGFGIARLTVEPAAGGRHPGSVNASLELVVP